MEKMKKLDGWGEVTVGNLEAGKQKRKPKGLKSQAALHNKAFVDYVKCILGYIFLNSHLPFST